jgi:hypothetical protein
MDFPFLFFLFLLFSYLLISFPSSFLYPLSLPHPGLGLSSVAGHPGSSDSRPSWFHSCAKFPLPSQHLPGFWCERLLPFLLLLSAFLCSGLSSSPSFSSLPFPPSFPHSLPTCSLWLLSSLPSLSEGMVAPSSGVSHCSP